MNPIIKLYYKTKKAKNTLRCSHRRMKKRYLITIQQNRVKFRKKSN